MRYSKTKRRRRASEGFREEPTAQEMVSAPASAVVAELRDLGKKVERQGQAIDSLAVAVQQLTEQLKKRDERGRDR